MRAALTGVVLLAATTAFAQAPSGPPPKLGYQGRLLAADGTPAQGMVNIRFDFFAASTGGTSLWSETQTLALTDGLYSTFLGEVTAIPSTVFDGSERWLELTIGGTALTPRQKVASVPYALFAKDPRLLASCGDGEILKWSQSQTRWACAPDAEGVSMSTLSNYVTTGALSSALASYTTTASLNATLASYVTQTALTTALADYATTASLSNYVTTAALTSTLSGYATTASLSSYVTAASLTSALSGYVTTPALNAAISNLAPAPANCIGPGRALQWNGSSWYCVDVRATGLSGGAANGYEVRDDWGDTWDGVQRPARTWNEANALCASKGGRLPTVTEVWRNRANYGTGNVGGPNETAQLWTVAPSFQPGWHSTAMLSNGSANHQSDTSPLGFRCIWKSSAPAGFTGSRCFGPPGSECRAKDAFFNLDRWSRAPQFFAAAQKECDLEDAMVANAEDLELEIQRGIEFNAAQDFVLPAWHQTSSGNSFQNGYNYLRGVRWTTNPEPSWGPDNASANMHTPSEFQTFRCVGKKVPTSGTQPSSPACNGSCFVTSGRTRLIADNINRAAANWNTAYKACAALGGSLPTAEEYLQLVPAGWQNGNMGFMWSASPSVQGWQLYRWSGTGPQTWNPHYDWGLSVYTGSFSPAPASYAYRCVWRETSAAAFTSCAANEVQLRDATTGADSCVPSVNGNSNGQGNPSGLQIIDAWGNAFDVLQRAATTYAAAKASCESLGGRLPLATELFRVRANQALVSSIGDSSSTSFVWTLNPDFRSTHQTQVRVSDGTASADLVGNMAPYRCIWPATRPTAFSGNACYGTGASRCFETGRLRTDSYPRAAISQPAAQWECRFLGGRLPSVREVAQLQQASLPNSVANVYEWTREWANWNGTTYAFMTARGGNGDRTAWAFDLAGEASIDVESSYRNFRCVFTDLME